MSAELQELIALRLTDQKRRYPPGFPCDRNGIRLGLASIQDELKEALDAWHVEKRHPFKTNSQTFHELLDVIAVAIYTAEGFYNTPTE